MTFFRIASAAFPIIPHLLYHLSVAFACHLHSGERRLQRLELGDMKDVPTCFHSKAPVELPQLKRIVEEEDSGRTTHASLAPEPRLKTWMLLAVPDVVAKAEFQVDDESRVTTFLVSCEELLELTIW